MLAHHPVLALGKAWRFSASALEIGAQPVIQGLNERNQIPIIMGKAHQQEETPDGHQCAHVLRVLEAGKRKFARPRNSIAKLITVEDANSTQAIKHAQIEKLAGDHQRQAETNVEGSSARRPEGSLAID